MKILMVCLGNICRSPLAEGILKHKIKENQLQWEVDSAGTSGWHNGEQPDKRSIQIAKKYGIDITDQQSRKLRSVDYEEFDLIYAMDSQNYKDILSLAKEEEREKIKIILNEVYPNTNKNVPDPYWDDNGFEKVYQMLEEACEAIIQKYKPL
ncbi:MAG: low molecular weight phosphotyrosine protein phosphatase [Chitinophagales bacterium]|nr:low molecular weight phosphotyrosine protein phosphatase [Chitinophagales bacterium]MCZ2394551.1 low molecular weight phosphotyrosine protein phosphatase [Chitinophagales bacterium]